MAENEEVEEGSEEKKGGSNLVLIIVIVLLLLVLVVGGILGFMALSGDDEDASMQEDQVSQQSGKQKKKNKKSTDLLTIGPIYPLDQFIVNLVSDSGRRFLKVSMDLELSGEELTLEMDSKKSVLRDIIIRTLSSKTFEEISTQKGKEKLKEEINEKINEVLADGYVKNLFFTSFVIQ
jgi:flagellar FliL protein